MGLEDDRDALASQVAALREAMEWASKEARGRLPDWWHATLASSAEAAREHDGRLRREGQTEMFKTCIAHVKGENTIPSPDFMVLLAEHDAKVRVAALEEACTLALDMDQNAEGDLITANLVHELRALAKESK